jgi:outer membrane biosynthesis protein TonB
MDSQEKKNQRVGWLTSVGVHGALFLVLFFVMAWRAPDPPLPEYGIELNFGLDDQGSGDVQPEETAGAEGESATESPATESQPTESEPTQKEPDPAEDKTSEPAASKLESPVAVKEEMKAAETPKAPDKPTVEPKKEAVVSKTESVQKTPTEDAKKGVAASHGDDAKKEGDKGSKEGTLEAESLYGTPGGGGGGTGVNFQMTGWTWADKPELPLLADNESGKVVFEIECDANGDITRISTVERTLSVRSEQMLKDMIRKNSLIRTSSGAVPERSTGRMTFTLRTK